jgi:3-oxoacyl-[acyl-carrier protein] reductase
MVADCIGIGFQQNKLLINRERPMPHLSGKTAVITGASKGIGAATAREFAQRGCAVVLAARSTDAIEALAAEINAAGGRAVAVRCDVSQYADVQAAMALAQNQFGSLDFLVNNAGTIDPIALLDEADTDAWGQAIDINLKGVFYGMRAALPVMKAQGSGVIVNVSSGAATSPLEGWGSYCAGKAGALMLTRCAATELAGTGIRVVGLSPGTVATEMQVKIKASGINPVSELDPSVHVPAEWPALAIAWLCGPDAAGFDGVDVSLRDENLRRNIGVA